MLKVNKTQKGFAATEAILILVIVALVAFIAWYAFHTKNSTDNSYNNAANTQLNPPQSSKTNNNTKTAAPASLIQTKTNSTVGQYLADGNGKTLYTYGADTSGVSNCSGSCLTDWPVYAATSTSSTLPANVTVIHRSDGGTQYAYKGMPLYYFTGDSSAGQVTGDGVSDFHVAKP
jgi:predicted lipoprotein with Yx(FWY)xxD motif